MHFVINGQPRVLEALAPGHQLKDLIDSLGLVGDRVAVEHNGVIVTRAEWPQTPLQDGDRLEIVHFVGGGSGSIRPLLLLLLTLIFSGVAWGQAGVVSSEEDATIDLSGSPTLTVTDLPTDRPLRIVAYGDMRFTDPSNTGDTWPVVRKWLAQKVGEEEPDLLLLTGDMPYHGSSAADWKVYASETASWSAKHLRVYPTIGNHELLPDLPSGLRNYYQAYPQIAGHRWYSVRLGNLYLISLDSTSPLSPEWPQREWLDAQLDHLPDSVDFVFLLFHIPLVADIQTSFMLGIPGSGTLEVRQSIEAHAAKSHAKFVAFNGHLHNYERFEINGVTHVITGGGGARPYPVYLRGDQDQFHGRTYPNFNYVHITLQGKHADARMYRIVDPKAAQMQLELSDSFSLDAK